VRSGLPRGAPQLSRYPKPDRKFPHGLLPWEPAHPHSLVWSPDGSRIAYVDRAEYWLTSFDIKANAFDPLPNVVTETARDFEGKTDYNKEGSFKTSISVTVIDVMPNGNLVIEGKRNIFMDEEEKTIQITGLVRPIDVSPENTVTSDRVSEARVSYVGEGPNTQNTQRNWFDEVLSWLWPF